MMSGSPLACLVFCLSVKAYGDHSSGGKSLEFASKFGALL